MPPAARASEEGAARPCDRTRAQRTHAIAAATDAAAHARAHTPSPRPTPYKRRSVEMLGVLLDEGMNVARLNFSHGDHAAHGATMDRVKEAAALRPGAPR